MGKGNAAVREWMSNPVRFSDLYNGIVFQGKQVVLPEELEPAEGETDILLEDNEQKVQEIHRYRDIVMRWKKGALLVLLACENQEKVHYAMTVRNMLYDSLSYAGQIQQLWKEREKEEKQKMTAPEFLSKWKKDDHWCRLSHLSSITTQNNGMEVQTYTVCSNGEKEKKIKSC